MQSTFVMVQMKSVEDPMENLAKAAKYASEAKEKFQADLLLFPEVFMSMFPSKTPVLESNKAAEPLDGPFVTGMRKLAKDNDVWVVFGMKEKTEEDDGRAYNTCLVVDNHGEIISKYHKTHMYDAFGYKESNGFKPGDRLFAPIDTPFGKLGLFVCYEVRFPEVARYEATHGADIILMPTSWVKGDLKTFQFRTLVTARAIENTVFVLACNQCGGATTGESVAVDPMGVAIAAAGETDALVPVFIDTDRIAQVRKKLPSFGDRRMELYEDGIGMSVTCTKPVDCCRLEESEDNK